MAWTAVLVGRQPIWTMELLSPATFNIAAGATHQASAQALFANGDVAPRSIAWSTSNAGIATVNASTGLVTGVAVGSVTITATCEGHTDTAAGTITSPTQNTVASVVPSIASGAVNEGGVLDFTVEARDSGGTVLPGKTFTAVSSQPSKASVAVNGSTISVTGILTGAPSPDITVTCETIDSTPVTVTVSVVQSGFPNKPASFINAINRPFSTKAATNGDRGTGSLPNKVGGSEGWDGIEYNHSFLSIVADGSAPFSPSNVLQMRYPAITMPPGTSFSPGVLQTLDFQNALYAGLGVNNCRKIYLRWAAKWSANFYGHATSTNKFTFIRSTNDPQGNRFEPIIRLRGVGAGNLKLNIDLQGSLNDPRIDTGGLDPNTAGAAGVGANAVPRGVWHTFEALLGIGTFIGTGVPDAGDGEFEMWMDGVKTHDYHDIIYHRPSHTSQAWWASWTQSPVWGGVAGTIPAEMYIWQDDVSIWLKA